MSLDRNFVDTVCQPGKGAATCSFLLNDGEWSCGKGTVFEQILKQRRASASMRALGDNCSGPPTFQPNK